MYNLASTYASLGRYADALPLHEDTLARRRTNLSPNHPDTLMSMWGMAECLVKLGRGAEAVPTIDDCIGRAAGQLVHPQLIPGVLDLRLRHFEKTRDPAGCRATAEMWEKLKRTDAGSLYRAARYRAVTCTVLRAGDQSETGTRDATAEADRAMAWLGQAVAAGYTDAVRLKKDRDMDALRDREDFKQLLTKVQGQE
jgi:hypothetical protein